MAFIAAIGSAFVTKPASPAPNAQTLYKQLTGPNQCVERVCDIAGSMFCTDLYTKKTNSTTCNTPYTGTLKRSIP